MQSLFGIPIGPLAVVLVIALALVVSVVSAFALRNRVFFKLGVRNVRRRRGRTALIVTGLMLGTTIIAAALASGDTMSHTIRISAIEALGSTDEIVSVKRAEVSTDVPLGEATSVDYFRRGRRPADHARASALLALRRRRAGDRRARRRAEPDGTTERAAGHALREHRSEPCRVR